MITNAIISVSPKYVSRMRSGEKKVELRRRVLRLEPGAIVWVYETSPVNSVTGYFSVSRVDKEDKEVAWANYQDIMGVSRGEYDAYFSDLGSVVLVFFREYYSIANPIHLSDLQELNAEFTPPQFYSHLTDRTLIKQLCGAI